MKKILLTTAAVAALSTSAFAEMDNMFYLRGDVGAAMFNKFKTGDVKIKRKTVADIDVGFGYNFMDNVRAELIFDKPFLSKMKGTKDGITVSHKPTINALFARVHGDVFDFGMGKFFLTGGLGWSQVKDKTTLTEGGDTATLKGKNKNNLAWTIGAGAGFDVAEGVHLDVAYSYRDYGKSKKLVNTLDATETLGAKAYRSHNLSAGVRFDI